MVALSAALALTVGAFSAVSPLPALAAGCASGIPGDVNGDGHAEAVVAQGNLSARSGAVHVFYGQAAGLVADPAGSALDDQYFSAASAGIPPAMTTEEDFGASNVLADFNDDGCADLAVGAPNGRGGGRVVVLYGSAVGLTTAGSQSIAATTVTGSQPGGGFGTELSSGDLDDDGIADLVVGAPATGEQTGGGVGVIYGATGGLGRAGKAPRWLSQATAGVPGTREGADAFGAAVAVGDFDGDGVADLAVGVPGEDDGSGIVQVLRGRAGTGVSTVGARSFSQNSSGVADVAEAYDRFGESLAAGDATGDGRDDLAVGAPGEDAFATGESAGEGGKGVVTFLPGSRTGLSGRGSQRWSQDSAGVAGQSERSDHFGSALVMAPLDAGPRSDLAIGSPGDSVGAAQSSGSVTVLLGAGIGLTTAGVGGTLLSQDTPGMSGTAETNDQFGHDLAAPRVQTRTRANLVIGAPQESIGGNALTGQVHQLAATATGPSATRSRTFHLDTPGVKGVAGPAESQFGRDVG